MRNFLFGLAALSAVLFSLSLFQIIKSSREHSVAGSLVIRDLKGFEDSGPNSADFKELREKFNTKVTNYRDKEGKVHTWWLVVSFVVTTLTAASTLVSTISAAKNSVTVPVSTVRLIAIITFVATLANWGSGQLTEAKTKAVTAIQAVKDLRSSFYSDYQQEASEEKKKALIDNYSDKLNDL